MQHNLIKMKIKVLYTHAHVSAHVQKVLSFSFSKNSVSNYPVFSTFILEYFNYSIGCRVPQKVYFYACFYIRLYMYMMFISHRYLVITINNQGIIHKMGIYIFYEHFLFKKRINNSIMKVISLSVFFKHFYKKQINIFRMKLMTLLIFSSLKK